MEQLELIAGRIDENPPGQIFITGHTARVGTEYSCLFLSNQRAEAVQENILSLSAFDRRKIITRQAGSSEPIADNSTPEGRSQNRRAEIRLVY